MKMKKLLQPQVKKRRFGPISLNLSFFSSFMAVVVGMLFGLVILFLSNPSQALDGFAAICFSPIINGLKQIGQVFYYATPLIMTGLSVGFAFKTGLFNIGASGQFTFGAYGAIMVGVYGGALGGLHWVVALLAATLLGALWAAIPGLLKAYANVHEVISSIMMNYIGMYLVNYLIVKTCFNSLKNQSMAVLPSAYVPKMGLDQLFPGSHANGGFIIAIACAILLYIVLNKTTFGYELKAVGYNREASRYAGINEKVGIVYSMIIAGALSGLGGGLLYLAGSGKNLSVVDELAAEGFNGISVALLGLSHPLGVLAAGIFLGYITVGGFNMQLYDFVPEIVDIITAAIIYFAAFALILKGFINNQRSRRINYSAGDDIAPHPEPASGTAPPGGPSGKGGPEL
jgi:general nucleoside transport system permease protein